MAQADDDPVASAKKLLADTAPLAATLRKPAGGKDVELPNPTGEIDPRLLAWEKDQKQRQATARTAATAKAEQPKDVASNVRLRRSLTAGGKR